jgi:serine protease
LRRIRDEKGATVAAAREDNGVTVCTCARRNRQTRRPGRARHVPLAAPAAVLALAAMAGCSAQADGGGGTAGGHHTAGTNGAAVGSPASPGGSTPPGGPGSGGTGTGGTGPAGGPGSGGTGTGGTGSGGSGPGACASWPSGSTRTVLLVTAGSSGKTYCVRTGETVDVILSGTLSLANGSQLPQRTGNALDTGRQARVRGMTAETYTAVRPGTSALIVVRLPCHTIRPVQGSQGSPAAEAPAGSTAAPAVDTAYRAGSAPVSGAVPASEGAAASGAGGGPVGTNCAAQQVLRVTISVS